MSWPSGFACPAKGRVQLGASSTRLAKGSRGFGPGKAVQGTDPGSESSRRGRRLGTGGANRALDLSQAAEPVLLPAERFSQLGDGSSFSVAFWLQTNELGEISPSPWNGKETVWSPAAFAVDPSGRIRFYSGQPNQHQALRAGLPVADGRWHRVAAVYEANRSSLRRGLDSDVSELVQKWPERVHTVPVSRSGNPQLREVQAETESRPAVELVGNFSNPFSKKTIIAYTVHEPSSVTIIVWDLDGHLRAEIVRGMKDPGYRETFFAASDLPSGMYFLRLGTEEERQSRRMVVLK